MENFLQNLTQTEIFVTLVSVLTANFGSIIAFIITAVKQMIKKNAMQGEFEAKCTAYLEQAKQNALEIIEELRAQVASMEAKFIDTTEAIEAAKKQEIQEQAIQLSENIEATKQQLNQDINSILAE